MAISDYRRHFATILDQVLEKHERVVGETSGSPSAVLEPPEAAELEISVEEF